MESIWHGPTLAGAHHAFGQEWFQKRCHPRSDPRQLADFWTLLV